MLSEFEKEHLRDLEGEWWDAVMKLISDCEGPTVVGSIEVVNFFRIVGFGIHRWFFMKNLSDFS
jgi:hypothetical protein